MNEKKPALPADLPWLEAKVDQLLAKMNERLPHGLRLDVDLIVTPLTEPPEFSTPDQRLLWDITCDNCGKVCSDGIYTGAAYRELRGTRVCITFGCCGPCGRRSDDRA